MLTYADEVDTQKVGVQGGRFTLGEEREAGVAAYADICWRMLADADVCALQVRRETQVSPRMLTYADECYADVC